MAQGNSIIFHHCPAGSHQVTNKLEGRGGPQMKQYGKDFHDGIQRRLGHAKNITSKKNGTWNK